MAAKKKKPKIKFARYMQRKLLLSFLLVLLLMTGLAARLIYIQRTSGAKYEKEVLNQQGYDSRAIPFRRGDILDCRGTTLATSLDVYNVILDCAQILEDEKYLEPTLAAITQCFSDITEEEVRGLLAERPNSRYYILRRRLPYEEVQDFVKLQEERYTEGKKKGELVNPDVVGIWFEKEYVRSYPYDTLACKVLGFTTSGNEGIGGLEDYYNNILNGTNGRRYGYLNTDSDFETVIKEAVNGYTLYITLDRNVQSIVERKIAEFDAAHRDEFETGPGSRNTAVLVMNPQNGEIISMADSTGFSLNDPWDEGIFNAFCMDYLKYSPQEIEALSEDARLDALNALWQNFCITYTFEPGSTVKPLTVATGLDIGVLHDGESFYCDGGEWVTQVDYVGCVRRGGHDMETLEETIMNSCNDALMQMSYRIGTENFTRYQNIFNIGLRTNIDLPGEARTDTLIYTAENMDAASLATNSFGQNFNITMIQVASAISSLINGGYYFQPHFLKQIVDENGATVQEIEPVLLKQTVSRQTSDLVRRYMASTVERGTGKTAHVPGYSMGGKTGTAEKYPRGEDKYVLSYIGFAPAENPQVLIYVVINEANVEDQASQSRLATILAKDIMAEILPYLNIYPDQPIEEEPEEPAAPAEGGEPTAPAEGGEEPTEPVDPAATGENGGEPTEPGENGGDPAATGESGGNPAEPGENGGEPETNASPEATTAPGGMEPPGAEPE